MDTTNGRRSADWKKTRLAGLAVTLVGIMMFGSGCVHTLEVKNMRAYENMQMNPLQKPITIGVVPSTEDANTQQLMKGIGTALGRYSATVLLPYSPGSASKADVVANIKILSEYKGSGWNFLINFPGFLIFTPAWNGYVYKANYNVEIMLAKGADNSRIDAWSTPINLDLRQAEFDRTWTEISWLEVGAIAFIGGCVFTGYDTDVTQPLVEKIENPIGDYIAQEIVNRINNSGKLLVPAPAAAPAAAAPPVAALAATPPAAATPASAPLTTAPPAETAPVATPAAQIQ
jgi:hypothetical protein